MNWENTKQYVTMYSNEKVNVTFNKISDKKIEKISSPCNCITEKLKNNKLVVSYKAKKTPRHLMNRNSRTIKKMIKVLYEDGEIEFLSIEFKILHR